MSDPQIVKQLADRYGLSQREAELSADRRKVYGDAKVNHHGIAMAWAGLLQPWAHRIAQMLPLPPHVIALCMCGVKLNRQRMVFHADNADDMNVYQAFARTWQKEWDEIPNRCPNEMPMVLDDRLSPEHVLAIRWEPEVSEIKSGPVSKPLVAWLRSIQQQFEYSRDRETAETYILMVEQLQERARSVTQAEKHRDSLSFVSTHHPAQSGYCGEFTVTWVPDTGIPETFCAGGKIYDLVEHKS